jgi:hypothetical protein
LLAGTPLDGKAIDPARAAPKDFAAHQHPSKEDSVLVDVRTYRIKSGKTAAHLDIYEKHGFAAQVRHIGHPLCYLQSESGELNTVVHLWAYEDAADRAKKRAAMYADPEWQNYLRLTSDAGYTLSQQNNLMVPTGFAPLKR